MLEDLSLNQTRATESVRLAGGMNTRSKGYRQSFTSKQYKGIMTVTAVRFEDEAEECSRVYAIFRDKGGFGRNNKDPPFYVLFDTREQRDAARRSYGPHCLNCGEDNHFARECPSIFINRFGLIHPAVGEGTPDEAENVGAGGKNDFVTGPVLEQNEMVAIHDLAPVGRPTCR